MHVLKLATACFLLLGGCNSWSLNPLHPDMTARPGETGSRIVPLGEHDQTTIHLTLIGLGGFEAGNVPNDDGWIDRRMPPATAALLRHLWRSDDVGVLMTPAMHVMYNESAQLAVGPIAFGLEPRRAGDAVSVVDLRFRWRSDETEPDAELPLVATIPVAGGSAGMATFIAPTPEGPRLFLAAVLLLDLPPLEREPAPAPGAGSR